MTNLLIQEKYLIPENIEHLKTLGYNVLPLTPDMNIDKSWPEVLCVGNSFDLSEPQSYPNLRFVQLFSAGYDKVNIELATKHNIIVSNARGAYSVQIAEYVLARLLSVYKKEREFENLQTSATWNQRIQMKSLVDQKVAILGTGSIGQEIAKRLIPFETHLTGFNTDGRLITYFDEGQKLSQLKDTIQHFDIVIICLPLNNETHYLFNKELLLKMNEEASLINIGRGPIIVEDDLIDILDSHLHAVILDVFENEPLSKDSPLWHHPKAYLTSHVSFNDNTTTTVRNNLIMSNLKNYIEKQSLLNRIN